MSVIDWIVFVAFLAYVVGDGLRRSRGTKDLEGYFVGGRSIPWWAAGLSIMATQASAITVIGTTGQGHDGGMDFVQAYFGLPFAMVLLSIFMVPLYRRLPILTAYEYLERRFDARTRTLASLIFLVSRCLAFGIVIYAPSVVLSALLQIPIETTVIAIGVLTTGYTLFGGVNAVIWTDVKQMLVIVGGLLVVLVILLQRLLAELDWGGVLTALGAAGKLNALEVTPESSVLVPRLAIDEDGPRSFWEEKYNVWSGLIGGLFLHLAYFGCDQSQVQRILTNPTARESRMALLMSGFAKVPMQLGVLFIGVLLWLFYTVQPGPLLFDPSDRAAAQGNAEVAQLQEQHEALRQRRVAMVQQIGEQAGPGDVSPDLLRDYQAAVVEARALRERAAEALHGEAKVRDTNYVFPHFVLTHVPPVLLGLIIAAIFAAAMSSADSTLNSLTAATVVDFYRRWLKPRATEAQALLASRVVTLCWGAAATVAALSLRGGGSIVEWINKVGSFFYGSLLGVFALALLVPGAGPRAGFYGLLGGMTSVLLAHWTVRIEFLWYNVIGCLGVLATAGVLRLLGADRR
ncbi:MAG: sodium:solute symporter [Planctomycetota bacterium]